MEFTPLTQDQRQAFERDGFLVVPNALPPDMVQRLLLVTDRLYQEGLAEEGLNDRDYWQMRNCLVCDDLFLELLDWPTTVPLIPQLLGSNIQLITSHLIVRPPSPTSTGATYKQSGWHRDGGTAPSDLAGNPPRMFIKISYWLTDLSEKGRGAIRLVSGSNNLSERPPEMANGDLENTIEIQVAPGTAVLFENRTFHAVGPNLSEITRKSLFFGYGYRWLRPMDYITMPPELLARCGPIRRQLLGDCSSTMGFQLPEADEVPLRPWLQEHTGQMVSREQELPGTFAVTADKR